MSVVIAIKKDGVIYMGADSQVSRGGTRSTLSNPNNYKIWSMRGVDNCLMGTVGNLRVNNVLKVEDGLIPPLTDLTGGVDFRFVVKEFIPHIMEVCNEYDLISKDRDGTSCMEAELLLAYHDRLYSIDRYGCVIEVDDFCAIGSGSGEAIGSLISSDKQLSPVERIKMAIKASAAHDIYVDYPIVISDTQSTDFKVFYEKDL
jgi:ATP-dependent protease HslVU (ClpYQ) peptidase subunit